MVEIWLPFLNDVQVDNTNAQILKDTYMNIIIKAILPAFFILLKIEDAHSMKSGIYAPVFMHSGRTVFKKFDSTV